MTEATTRRFTLADAPAIGQYWEGQGGIYAGIMPDYEGTQPRFLIFAADEMGGARWGGVAAQEERARNGDYGRGNTEQLAECRQPSHVHEAARFAATYEKDGHDDFYLPSKRELDLAYETIRDTFDATDWYWSSTEKSRMSAYGRNFGDLELTAMLKQIDGRSRPVRSLPVSAAEPAGT
ncbi:hypothetical protein C0Z18_09980 [Trinickia dabaoshanensis]|uniref:DUF1566 domain-containing protein n=1 Tax=Trinickia dabaoshanensis TaxID=564714 RepID=A0A2N7VUL9_9BURK|nr:hypothetical protein [Trinickia dabaoshanensis]PMS20852.1 hypothetical protein C0Z18_09980 [Trinickia dabaoshanensis]